LFTLYSFSSAYFFCLHFPIFFVLVLFLLDFLFFFILLSLFLGDVGGSPIDAALLDLQKSVQFFLLSIHLSQHVMVEVRYGIRE